MYMYFILLMLARDIASIQAGGMAERMRLIMPSRLPPHDYVYVSWLASALYSVGIEARTLGNSVLCWRRSNKDAICFKQVKKRVETSE